MISAVFVSPGSNTRRCWPGETEMLTDNSSAVGSMDASTENTTPVTPNDNVAIAARINAGRRDFFIIDSTLELRGDTSCVGYLVSVSDT